MVAHILKMCTFFLCTFHEYFSLLRGVELRHFSYRKMLRRCLGSVIIRIGLQNRFQDFKQRASKGIQIGSVVFVAIFSWRRAQKKTPPDKNA